MMKEREVWVTYLLWFFAGVFGVHKFYLDNFGMGLIYLLTGGLFMVGWFVDLFTIPFQVAGYNAKVRARSRR